MLLAGCATKSDVADDDAPCCTFHYSDYPWVTEHEGLYYFMKMPPHSNSIFMYVSDNPKDFEHGREVMVLNPKECVLHHIWSPELHRINDKWYIYFEGDDGVNTDNHQIYVLENVNEDPTTGEWMLHGPIVTNEEWNFGLHPSSFVLNGKQYLLWSGWEHRRTETETQCIFIAEMENPWTLKSERVLISKPDFEWERQWVKPNGRRSAYPIFVNENPEPFVSPDGKFVFVGYSASGIWTPYHLLGLLYAPADADLLKASSWTKCAEPQFMPEESIRDKVYGVSNISVLTLPGEEQSMIFYDVTEPDAEDEDVEASNVYVKRISWNEKSMPIFGLPK